MRLDDFAKSEMAQTCKLSKPEVLAMRFYTTAGYKTINDNLRDESRRERATYARKEQVNWSIKGATGLKWKNVGATKPAQGRELTNSRLSNALASKTEFKTEQDRKEWKMCIKELSILADLRSTDFIRSGNSYFKPDPEPHPFPVMVFLLWMGVKKLRTFASKSMDAMQKRDLYRGMSNVGLNPEFLKRGGTELAPMSTTADLKIAIEYGSKGLQSVLLRVRTTGFMNFGAQLKWLSAFPFEEELLYPPITFLKPLRLGLKPREFKIGNATFKVIDVEPQLS